MNYLNMPVWISAGWVTVALIRTVIAKIHDDDVGIGTGLQYIGIYGAIFIAAFIWRVSCN